MKFKFVLVSAFCVVAANASLAASCMVIGEKTARIQSSEGEKSPVFLTNACASLRLISGKAMVTWVARDGKPNFVPIGPNGPDRVPTAGTEERSSNVVWAELSSKRETQRPAFMRALDVERPARIYIPADGLVLPFIVGASLRVLSTEGDVEKLVFETTSTEPVLLARDLVKSGAVYVLEWNHAGKLEKWKWKALSAEESVRIDAQVQEVQLTVPDEVQRRVVTAMLFEQLKLRVNMELALPAGF